MKQISDIEEKNMENKAEKKRKTKAKGHNTRLGELSDLLKRNNIQIIGVPEDEEKDKGAEGLCEQIVTENLPNLGKDTDIKIQEAQRTSIRFNKNQPPPRQIHKIFIFTKYQTRKGL